jgi:surfeit locus 1 family protein
MRPRRRFRRLLVPALMVLPVLALLLALGTWQVGRLRWKTELLARIAAAEAAPPQPLPAGAAPEPYAPEPYAKVLATGRFDHGREALLGVELRGTTLGSHLLTPLLREGGAHPLLVNRGWVPLERTAPVDRPEGEVTITGYVRPPDRRDWNSPRDDTAGRRFYLFDPGPIAAALGLPGAAPYGLVALAPPGAPPGLLPAPARDLPRPNNPHLGYVITWYGLALALVGVFVAFARRRLAEDGPAPAPGEG